MRRKIACRCPETRRGSNTLTVLTTLTVVIGAIAATWFWVLGPGGDVEETVVLHEVARGPFLHEVIERGEVESSRNVEVVCEVKSRNSEGTAILEVVEEGLRVEAGDVICRLDASALEQELIQQQIACNASKALLIQARNAYEAAVASKKEYLEGTYFQEEQTLQSAVFVAEENLRRAQQYLKFSERLAAKGYVTELQLEGDRFAVEKAVNELEAARTALRVLQEYTKPKMLKDLDAAVESAEAQWQSEESSYKLELTKQQEIEDQIAKCVIQAPQAGQVVYANRTSRRSESEFVVEPGALVRERQVIIRLPDPTMMRVKAEVSESRITLIKVGMPVTIRLDAFGDEELAGEVIRVNEYPEPSSWFSSQVKKYAAFIKIFEPPSQIRPGLTAEVKVLIESRPEALTVPVQSVHEHGGQYFCFLREGDKWAPREVTLAASNDKFVVVEDGLQEFDLVSMAPRTLLNEVELPPLDTQQQQQEEAAEALGDRDREPATLQVNTAT